jgi:hypothetical protein
VIIAVPLLRQSFLKGLGSVIDTAIKRGHSVVILRDAAVASKVGETIYSEQIHEIWPGVEIQDVDLTGAATPDVSKWDALIGLEMMEPGSLADLVDSAMAHDVPVYSVSDLYESAVRHPALMARLACTFYVSPNQHQMHRAFRSDGFSRLSQAGVEPRVESVGCTYNDQYRFVDQNIVRQALGIQPGRPVVLFMTLKMGVPESFRRFAWGEGPKVTRTISALARGELGVARKIWEGPHYRDLVRSLRDFCDREGALLIGKSRLKNTDPDWMGDYLDLYTDRDRVEFPYTSMQLLAISDLCVHFESTTVLETAQIGVRSLSVVVPQDHLMGEIAGFTSLFRSREPGSLFNTPGIVDSIPYERFPTFLQSATLDSLRPDLVAQESYVRSFLHFDDFAAADRILDTVERGAS